MAMFPLTGAAPAIRLSPQTAMAMLCHRCEVTWRGPRDGPCWSCGMSGEPASPATTVVD